MRAINSFPYLVLLLVLLVQTIYADVGPGSSPSGWRFLSLLLPLFVLGIYTVAVAGLTFAISLPNKPVENVETQQKSKGSKLLVLAKVIGILLGLIVFGFVTLILLIYLLGSGNYLLLILIPTIIGAACGKAVTEIFKGRIKYLKHKKALTVFFALPILAYILIIVWIILMNWLAYNSKG